MPEPCFDGQSNVVVAGVFDAVAVAFVRTVCARGWRVTAMLHDDEPSPFPVSVRMYRADLANENEVEAAFSSNTSYRGRAPDALLHFSHAPLEARGQAAVTESSAGWEAVQAQHLRSAFLFAQAGAREMLRLRGGEAVDNGSVVFVGSVAATRGLNGHSRVSMNAATSGLTGMTRQLAVEWGPYGIRVNMLQAGAIEGATAAPREIMSRIPLGRPGRPEEIAETCYHLISRSSSFITGVVLPVDGGFLAT